MEFLRPETLDEALAVIAERPGALPIAGGTDVMVELNYDHRRPDCLVDLTRIAELATWSASEGHVRLGAGVPYTRLITELGDALPGLAMAARTVGSPQIRSRGTVGGNLGAASPAGDTHPVLLAAGAEVEVASARGSRRIPATEFYTGVKRNALEAGELITAVHVPTAGRSAEQFSKIGTRNAMVIAVCSLAVVIREGHVRVAIGSAAPTPRRVADAEAFATAELPWDTGAPLPDALTRRFAELVGAATEPIDDVRGTAEYRTHALGVLARRALTWAWNDYRGSERACA